MQVLTSLWISPDSTGDIVKGDGVHVVTGDGVHVVMGDGVHVVTGDGVYVANLPITNLDTCFSLIHTISASSSDSIT